MLGCVLGHGGHDILYYAPKKRNGCISCISLYRVLDECTKRKVYVCLQQYRKHTEIGTEIEMNQWPLELFNGIELLDACAENRFRGSLTLECMWVCHNY